LTSRGVDVADRAALTGRGVDVADRAALTGRARCATRTLLVSALA
jgi:hypothetical protein